MKATQPKRPKPKPLKPHGVIVENDAVHTFPYVIIVMQKVFGYNLDRCQQIAKEIHVRGQSLVWSGSKEVAELKVELIRSAGPDPFGTAKFPLGCRIEELP